MRQSEDATPAATGRTLRMSGVQGTVAGLSGAPDRAQGRFAPSVVRSNEERERRHRERAIAAWLRDLAR